jgi:hypothetical protein
MHWLAAISCPRLGWKAPQKAGSSRCLTLKSDWPRTILHHRCSSRPRCSPAEACGKPKPSFAPHPRRRHGPMNRRQYQDRAFSLFLGTAFCFTLICVTKLTVIRLGRVPVLSGPVLTSKPRLDFCCPELSQTSNVDRSVVRMRSYTEGVGGDCLGIVAATEEEPSGSSTYGCLEPLEQTPNRRSYHVHAAWSYLPANRRRTRS